MRNEEKFKTAEERYDAFGDFCQQDCDNCKFNPKPIDECTFLWLADEYKEPDLPFDVDIRENTVAVRRTDTQADLRLFAGIANDIDNVKWMSEMCTELNAAALAWHKRLSAKGE